MAQYRSLLAGTGLVLSADAGTAWVSSPLWDVTVNGTTKVLYQWLVDLCNETIIMDYDRNASNLIDRANPYLSYADSLISQGETKSVTVGVAINSPGATPTWWQTGSVTELETLIATVNPTLASHPAFSLRYAIFTAGSLFNSSSDTPCPTCTFPERKTLWYLDDDWVYNSTSQEAFFNFACQQRVVQVYDAPHAGDRPHIGGNPADEVLYRTFVEAAGTRGIDIQFFSGVSDFAYDMEFIQSVNTTQPRNKTCNA